ncbi:MAG: ribbon-helix-helix protein, CopG family [Verrucomicrobia bacterium]|nr:ribbon-helix-helix protein, CopG family [Verrucomicrobiota bacterium]
MKTEISLPDAMFQAAERLARRLGISRSQLFQRALQQYLRDQRQLGVTEALDEIYAAEPKSRVRPILSRFQMASLPREEW